MSDIKEINNKEFIPSKNQKEIFSFVKEGDGNAVVSAVAGSGKTTTILKALNIIPLTQQVLYLAFNKDIVKSVKEKKRLHTKC